MNKKPSPMTFLLLTVIAVLLISTFHLSSRMRYLQQQLDNLFNFQHMTTGELRNIQSGIWDLSGHLNDIGQQMVESTAQVFGLEVAILGYDSHGELAEVDVTFYLRERSRDQTAHIVITWADGSTHFADTSVSDAGQFRATLHLPVQGEHIIRFTTDGDSIVTGELTRLSIEDMLRGRFFFSVFQGSNALEDGVLTTVSLDARLYVDTHGDSALEVSRANLFLEADGEAVKSWDLLLPETEQLNGRGFTDRGFIYRGSGSYSLTIPRDALSFTFDANNPLFDADAHITTRLVIYDALGIRYEQVDLPFFPWPPWASAHARHDRIMYWEAFYGDTFGTMQIAK